MQTSCPECRTAFRVNQEQLGLRRGLVRCGKCNAVFNAYDTLLPELAEPAIVPPEPMPDALSETAALPELSQPDWDDEFPRSGPRNSESGSAKAPQAEDADHGAFDRDFTDEAAIVEFGPGALSRPTSTPTSTPVSEPSPETPDSILLSELPNRRPAQPGLPVWKRVFSLLALLLLGSLLALQIAYFLRAELAVALPASRPALEQFCRPLGCVVPLPRQLGRQAIAASNLEHDAEQKSRVRLTFLLANRTGQTQAWPVVSLTLTDVREAPVARKLFPPEVYLPRETNVQSGMADGSEREVRLQLDIGNLAATGYALSLVYP